MYNITIRDNLIDFSKNRGVLFDLYNYNCEKDIDEAGKIFGIKKMYFLIGAIAIIFLCFISLVILMMKKSKSTQEYKYKSSKISKKKKLKK